MKQNFEFQPEMNYIIISKQGLNTAKNNRGNNLSQLTLKDGEHSVKINLNTSFDNKINKDNILQTISDYRKKFILLQKHKNNKFHHYKTSFKENNRQRYKNELIDQKNFSSYNSVDALQDINKLDKDNISNKGDNVNKTSENNNTNKNFNKSNNKDEKIINTDDNKLLVKNNNSLIIENKKKDDENENEENFVSSINKKSVKTLQIKKELQKSKQISDKAEISKVNSESDKFTDYDMKLKSSMKLKKINDNNSNNKVIISSDINEKEEYENEIIDNEKDIMTIIDNNENKQNEFNTGRNIDNNENNNNKIKTNNFFTKSNKIIDQSSILENSGGDDLIDKTSIKKELINKEKDKLENIDNNSNQNSDKNLIPDNTSENKKLIPIPILKKNTKNPKESATKEQELNENHNKKKVSIILNDPQKNTSSSVTGVNNIFLSQNAKQNSSLNNLNNNTNNNLNNNTLSNSNRIFFKTYQNIQKECYICEKPFYFIKLYYAECGLHFLCRKCLKSYYEDYLEHKNFSKILKCPCAQCDKTIDYEKIVKDIISESHQKIYENHFEDKNEEKDGDCTIDTNIKLYTKRHVLDINNNKNIYMFKKSRDRYCPRCLMPYLFSKTNNNFIKCLFCNLKICKYCLKEYTPKHLNLLDEDHCKIRFRRTLDEQEQSNCFIKFLIELFFVIATFILIFPGIFLTFLNKLNGCFGLKKKEKNSNYIIKSIFSWIFCVIFFIICFPFIILIYSMFPAFIALFDYQ